MFGRLLARESGTSLLELALALPFLLLLLAGTVEIGFPLYQHKKVLDAVRYVGEITAARPAEETLLRCNQLTNQVSLHELLDSYLTSANLNPDQWDISAEVKEPFEDSFTSQILSIHIKRNEKNRVCFLCKFGFRNQKSTQAMGNFKIIGRCET